MKIKPPLKRPVRGKRRSADPPPAVALRGWRYHHLGIPTGAPRPGERYLQRLRIHVSGFETSPYGIEWMRFEPDCAVPEIVRTVPHIAFEVDDLDAALEGLGVLSPPSRPSAGVRVAMILDDGAPVELIEFRKSRRLLRAKAQEAGRARRSPLKRRGSRPKTRLDAGRR